MPEEKELKAIRITLTYRFKNLDAEQERELREDPIAWLTYMSALDAVDSVNIEELT